MKIIKNGYKHGIRPLAKLLGTTRGTITWLIEIKKIKPVKLPIGPKDLLFFSPKDIKIIKAWVNKDK